MTNCFVDVGLHQTALASIRYVLPFALWNHGYIPCFPRSIHVARMATCFDCTVMCWTILELVWIFFGHRFLWTMNSSGFERCIRVRTCMIMLVHSIGCILIFLNCYFVDRPLSLSWCALCLQLIRFCRTLTMGLPQFGSVPPLYYDLVSYGLRGVTCGPFSTCTIKFQHWTIFGSARAMCCSNVQCLL